MNRIFLAFLACVSSIAPAAAQNATPAPAVEVGAGWAGFVDEGVVDHGTLSAAFRVHLTPRLSVGPELVHMNGPRTDRDLVVTGNVFWDLRRPVPGRRLTPFLVAGGGLYRHSDRFAGRTFSSTEGSFTAGGGLRADVTGRVYVAADARVGWETHVRFAGVVGVRLAR